MKNKEQKWTVPKGETHIPSKVRYSKQISYASKIIYGDICALSFKYGYCDAGNDYFAWLYDVDDKTISDWINQLYLAGFVKRKLLKGYKRHLTPVIGKITEKIIPKESGEVATTESPILPKNESSKGDKIQQDINTINNTTYVSPIEDSGDEHVNVDIEKEFNSEEAIKKLATYKQRWMNIIGMFATYKGLSFTNQKQINELIKRYSRTARKLEAFDLEQIRKAFSYCDKWKDKKTGDKMNWKLENVLEQLVSNPDL